MSQHPAGERVRWVVRYFKSNANFIKLLMGKNKY